MRLAVCLWQRLSLGQLSVALWPGQGAPIGAGLRGDGLPTWQGGVVVVAEVSRGGGSMVVGRSVASRAARSGDDGGGV